MANAIFSIVNKVTGEVWIGKSVNAQKKHKEIVKYLNSNGRMKYSPHDYDDNCEYCEFFDNCLGWDDKTNCKEWMHKYFEEHPSHRIKE